MLTEVLTGGIALNNICCLICFSLAAALIDLSSKSHAQIGFGRALQESLFPLAWQLIGSVALGYLIGLVLSMWASHVTEQGETLILMAGSVLLCVGFAEWLDLSPLIASLAVGATMVNLSARSRRLFDALSRTDPPLYAIFFVIAGADLNLALLPTLGILGAFYVVGRASGKFVGTRIAARFVGLRRDLQKLMGFAMLSQAGLAIGLVVVTNERLRSIGPTITTLVLASVAVFELVGPLGARFVLEKSGEVRSQDTAPAVLLDQVRSGNG